ncbi:MAG: MFS transporter [Pyrinomonadaceae bacterium]
MPHLDLLSGICREPDKADGKFQDAVSKVRSSNFTLHCRRGIAGGNTLKRELQNLTVYLNYQPIKLIQTSDNRRLKVLLHVVFFLSGIATVLIGQVLPLFSVRFALNDLQAGFFFPAQFAGSLAGTILTNWFGRGNRFILATVIGCGAMAAGLLIMNADSFAVCLLGFMLNGFGIGLTLPSINMLIVEMSPANSASALTFLNFFWGVGAIVCKPFVDLTTPGSNILPMTLLLAAPLLMAAVLVAFSPTKMPATEVIDLPDPEQSLLPIWTMPLAWLIALFNFIHVGFESGMGGWLTTYADRLHGEPVLHLLSPTFLFFLFFVIGRGVAPVFFRFLREEQVLLLDLGLMLAGMLIILSAGNLLWLGIGAAVAGFGTSSVFPTNLSRFTRTFGPTARRRATPFFICGTLGATCMTWLIGFLSDRTGTLKAGMYALLACVAVLILLQKVLTARRWIRQSDSF